MPSSHDPFSPHEPAATAVDLPDGDGLTGDAALRTEPVLDAPPLPEPEPAQKPVPARKGRRRAKSTPVELEEALARLDKATS